MTILGKLLLNLLLIGSIEASSIVYEDGEDKNTQGWSRYAKNTDVATVTNIYDNIKKSRVISLNRNGGFSSFSLGSYWNPLHKWNNRRDRNIRWSMKFDKSFSIYVSLDTDEGLRYMTYKPIDNYLYQSDDGKYIHHGIGESAYNGTWKTFERNLENDLKEVQPNNSIISVNSFQVSGEGLIDDIVLHSDKRSKKIFIIGASTVRYDFDDSRVGWGSRLKNYMKSPNDVYNRGRRGSIAGKLEDKIQSYYKSSPITEAYAKIKGSYDWISTKRLIENIDSEGYLFIQFGSNDKLQKVSENSFKDALQTYINEARELNLVPVLITPPNPRYASNTRGAYPKYIKDIAKRVDNRDVIFLNLHEKSIEKYLGYGQDEGKWGHLVDAQRELGVADDYTHFSPKGAEVVASWIRELACGINQSDEYEGDEGNEELCSLFK